MDRVPKILLLIESSREAGRALLRGIANYSHRYGGWSFYWEPGGLEHPWSLRKKVQPDGIIMRDTDSVGKEFGLGIPTVVVGHQRREVPDLVNVLTDSEKIGCLAADHLLSCGFRHFAFCGYTAIAREHTSWSVERHKAFSQRVVDAGYSPAPLYVLRPTSGDWPGQRQKLARWLQSLPKPLGVMTCNDDCGVQVMEACKTASLSVPDTVGIIGADDDEVVCGLSDPPMSSIGINFERAGYEAAEALDRLLMHRQPASDNIVARATHVVARRSTDVIAVEDSASVRAMRFIRNQARRPIGVDEVARAAGLSRRTLERRFRGVFGRSVLDQIRQSRSDEIARLLIETQLPVHEIASKLGFDDLQHFARYFRSTRKTTPLAYRRSAGY